MTTFYLDYENGDDSNNGSTWALAWKTITLGATLARIAPGDTIRIAKSPAPASLGLPLHRPQRLNFVKRRGRQTEAGIQHRQPLPQQISRERTPHSLHSTPAHKQASYRRIKRRER